MTREEKEKALYALKKSTPIMAMTPKEFDDYIKTLNKIADWLEQEPCEDCISRTQAIKAMDELENEDIEAYGCSIPEGFDGERARQAICLLPSVQPKTKTDVLDKIRAEIEQEYNRLSATRANETLELGECLGLKMSLKIIDKYKAESEKA